MSFCTPLPNFVKIETSTAEIWRRIDFQDGGHQRCCICFGVMADHPRSAFHGPNSVLKSLVRPINSSRDIAMYRFWRFGLLFTPLFGEFVGHIFPIWRHPFLWPPKGHSLGGNASFEPFGLRISATVRPGRMTEKKIQDNKKVTKVLYFPYLAEATGGSPHWTDLTQKLRGWLCPQHNHVCQVSNWSLNGLRFYTGSNFRFSYWFLHGPYISAALMRCLWC